MNILQLQPDLRKKYFEEVAGMMGLTGQVIEKDFWVVWALWRVFEQAELRPFLTFKGGTSLSKVYGVIRRFSEDVDLSIEKGFFGFGDENSPELAQSRKKRSLALDGLSEACAKYVQSTLLQMLKSDFAKNLGKELSWEITVDENEPDGQTLLFAYPTLYQNPGSYIRPIVRLELGARSEHWPVSERKIQSYVKQKLGENIQEAECKIKVLNIERTFWEKATILHAYAHVPADKKISPRLARHYYDMHCLIHSDVKSKAAKDLELLDRVVQHKIAYFASSWSQFEMAKKGSLKLLPSESLEKHLKSDFKAMRDMFFENPPAWEKIIESIADFEQEFNAV